LKSEHDGTYYYGSTKNLRERVKVHNSGKSRYTKGRRPWKLHYFEEFESRSDAAKREKFFKSIDGYNFLKKGNIIKISGGSPEGIPAGESPLSAQKIEIKEVNEI